MSGQRPSTAMVAGLRAVPYHLTFTCPTSPTPAAPCCSAAAAAAAAAAAGKKGAVCGVLQQRGYPPARVEALLSQPGAFRLWEQR